MKGTKVGLEVNPGKAGMQTPPPRPQQVQGPPLPQDSGATQVACPLLPLHHTSQRLTAPISSAPHPSQKTAVLRAASPLQGQGLRNKREPYANKSPSSLTPNTHDYQGLLLVSCFQEANNQETKATT